MRCARYRPQQQQQPSWPRRQAQLEAQLAALDHDGAERGAADRISSKALAVLAVLRMPKLSPRAPRRAHAHSQRPAATVRAEEENARRYNVAVVDGYGVLPCTTLNYLAEYYDLERRPPRCQTCGKIRRDRLESCSDRCCSCDGF